MEWIPVEKELPKSSLQPCLVCLNGHVQTEFYYYDMNTWWYLGVNGCKIATFNKELISHWTPVTHPVKN